MKDNFVFNRVALFLGTITIAVFISVGFASYMDRRANNYTTIRLETVYDNTEWIVVEPQEEYVVFVKDSKGYNAVAQIPIATLHPQNGDTTVYLTVNDNRINSGYKIIRFTMKQGL